MPGCKSSTEPTAAELERAGIAIDETWRGTAYIGTRDAIVAAGLAAREQIPGEPACPRTKAFRFQRDGRTFVVSFSARKGLAKVRALPTREEEEADWARIAAKGEAMRVAERARKEIESLPRSREAYEQIVRQLTSLRPPRDLLLGSIGGYSVTEVAWNEFEQALDMALDELLLEGIVFNRAARDREIAAFRQKAADADPDFARFMRAAGAGESS